MIRNIVVIGDTHFGCQFAVCKNEVKLDGGGHYIASNVQQKLYAMWREFWDEWVPVVTRGEKFLIVHLGDCIDGTHHGSTTQISHNIKDQERLAVEMLAPEIEKATAYYHIRGTEAHVGKSAESEERVAAALGAKCNEDGNHSRNDLWIRMDRFLLNFMHHIGTTGRMHYETSAVMGELAEFFTEAGKNRVSPPDMILRGHRHRYIKIEVPTVEEHQAIAMTVPAWQVKTPFTFKIPGGRVTLPQIGGVLIRVSDEGELYTRKRIWHIERSREVNLGEIKVEEI